MLSALMGASITLNVVLILLLYYIHKETHKKKDVPDIYEGIQDIMRNDEWDRIGALSDPMRAVPEEEHHTIVAAAGKRDRNFQGR